MIPWCKGETTFNFLTQQLKKRKCLVLKRRIITRLLTKLVFAAPNIN